MFLGTGKRPMRRREFITLVCASVVCPLAARAQQQAIPRIGYIWIGTREGTDVSNAGLRQGLIDRGYEIGRNVILEERYAKGDAARVPLLLSRIARASR
jgi:putative tryptophan/tyrosine transport system substrate-binding protein